jgi:hypothetical protein
VITFRLNEFKAIAKWLDKNLPTPLAFFLKGWLWALEERYIDAKVSSALDKAIAPLEPPEPTLTAPTFTSTPSEVEGLDIIELRRTRPQDTE